MKFTTTPKAVKAVCAVLAKAAARSSTNRALECARIVAHPDRVEVTATDLEWAATVVLADADVTEPGCRLVPVGELAKIGKAKAARIKFAGGADHGLHVEWSTARTNANRTLNGEDPAQFPEVRHADTSPCPELGPSVVDAKRYAGKEAARFILNSIRIGDGAVCACDGRSLYHKTMPMPEGVGLIGLPRFMEATVRGLDRVGFSECGRFVTMARDGLRITCRVTEGSFPDPAQILPKSGRGCKIDPTAWTEAIDALDGCFSGENNLAVLRFASLNGSAAHVAVAAKNGDASGAVRINQGIGKIGDGFAIGFNADCLRAALKLDPERFRAGSPNTAAEFVTGSGARLVLMPIIID